MKLFIPKDETFESVEIRETQKQLEVQIGDTTYRVQVEPLGASRYAMIINNHPTVVDVVEQNKRIVFRTGNAEIDVEVLTERERLAREMFGSGADAHLAGEVRAPMPGLILKVLVEAGDTIDVGQPLLIMEAMKMENEIRSPVAGTVKEILVAEQHPVEKDALLVVVE